MQHRESERKAIIRQAIYYTAAFFITFLFPAIRVFARRTELPIEIMYNVCYPLQGFWNFVLYIRPNVTKIKKVKPDKYLCEIIWHVILHSHERNEEVRQRWRKNEIKLHITPEYLKARLDADIDPMSMDGYDDSKPDICDELPGATKGRQSYVSNSEIHDEGDDINVMSKDGYDDSKQDKSDKLPGTIKGQRSHVSTMSETHDEGALHTTESSSYDKGMSPCAVVPHTSIASIATDNNNSHSLDNITEPHVVHPASCADYDNYSSDESAQPCQLGRPSLVFATAIDDCSLHSSESLENIELRPLSPPCTNARSQCNLGDEFGVKD